VGEFLSLAAAIIWACAVILFKRSGETVAPFTLNFFRVGVSSVLLAITLPALGEPLFRAAPRGDWITLIVSGVIGIGVADTLFHMSLNRVGAGITAVIDCLYSPFVLVFAFLIVEEEPGLPQFAGMALVISGVIVASRHRPPPGISRWQLAVGVAWGVLGMLALAFGIVFVKPVLGRSSILWATAVRQFSCLLVMLPFALGTARRRAEVRAVLRPSRSWRFTLTGTILGSYFALLCWIAGMKYTLAGTAAILNQTSTILVLVFATIFLGEPFTRRKALATSLAVGGILLVILG
jgi:drug/metabolite transporter (DMT)-like permease